MLRNIKKLFCFFNTFKFLESIKGGRKKSRPFADISANPKPYPRTVAIFYKKVLFGLLSALYKKHQLSGRRLRTKGHLSAFSLLLHLTKCYFSLWCLIINYNLNLKMLFLVCVSLYWNSLQCGFVFDDMSAVRDNRYNNTLLFFKKVYFVKNFWAK